MQKWCFILSIVITACTTNDSYLEIDKIDEVENDAYVQKCIAHNQWTYTQMVNNYFWYIEIPDSINLDFKSEPATFFKSILSKQDRFSWCEENLNYIESYSGLKELGFEYQTYGVCGSKVNRILYVSSPYLIEQGLKRGDYVNIVGDILERGIIDNGRFIVQQKFFLGDIITKGTGLAPTISLDSIYTINNKNIGYFVYDQFDSSTDVAQIAIRLKSKGIDDLVVDLRYNPGGYVSTSNYLASMLVPIEHLGRLYQLQRYNDKLTKEKQRLGGSGMDSVFLNKGNITRERNLNLSRLIVLTTKNTASASESLIIGLRPYMKVVTIGTTSCGKDVGSYTIADNKYKYQLQPITFRYYNALSDSTPITGIVPDIIVEDDLDHQRGDINEALLNAAINYLLNGNGIIKTHSLKSIRAEKEYGKSSIEIKHNL